MSELENVIVTALRSFAFSHSQGHKLPSAGLIGLVGSPRTLHTATQTVRGMSVHRYLRLRRLWSVRSVLTLGRPLTKISEIAHANGFWYMGEFASAYRATFGETPSQTLARHR